MEPKQREAICKTWGRKDLFRRARQRSTSAFCNNFVIVLGRTRMVCSVQLEGKTQIFYGFAGLVSARI